MPAKLPLNAPPSRPTPTRRPHAAGIVDDPAVAAQFTSGALGGYGGEVTEVVEDGVILNNGSKLKVRSYSACVSW